MKLLNQMKLSKYLKKHRQPSVVTNMQIFKELVLSSSWTCFTDIKRDFHNLRKIEIHHETIDRIVFKFHDADNTRIDTLIDYQRNTIYVQRIGTHEDYNKWDF